MPVLTAHVVDTTGTLAPTEREALEAKLAAFEQRKGTQVAMLLVPTTQPEDIASYANRVGNSWKIGRMGVGDGLLLLVAKNDRKVRIEVAKTLEGAIPDLAASRIIETAITPAFRRGDYAGGLNAAADQIIARIDGEPLPAPGSGKTANGPQSMLNVDWGDLAIFLFFAVFAIGPVVRRIFGGKLGSLLVGAATGGVAFWVTASAIVAGIAGFFALLATLLASAAPALTGRGGSGWGGGVGGGGWGGGRSSGGGGFSSGGGGDFGGGGASGGW
ncbi:MAG TPA: TPM domain-containing protein [Burkholderiaceae bacterium]